jgi:hypothetical protein
MAILQRSLESFLRNPRGSTLHTRYISVLGPRGFSTDPKSSHAAAIKRFGKHLLGAKDKGLILNPRDDHPFDCWVDADFCGNWDRVNADVDPSTAKSRTG